MNLAGGLEARKILTGHVAPGVDSHKQHITRTEIDGRLSNTGNNKDKTADEKSDTNSTTNSEAGRELGVSGRKPMKVSEWGSATEEVAVVYRAASEAEWVAYKTHGTAQFYDERMVTAWEQKGADTFPLKFAGKELGARTV